MVHFGVTYKFGPERVNRAMFAVVEVGMMARGGAGKLFP